MISFEKLRAMLKSLEGTYDSVNYPRTADVIASALIDDEAKPPEVVRELINADETLPMSESIAAFVKTVLEDAIADDDAGAACDLGALYYTGRIGEQSYAKAVELYTLAAGLGDRQAAENLGYCYYYGRDVERDYEKAFHFFALGAFDGHLISLYKIGDMYRYGLYVRQNPKEAFCIYMHCLDMLNADSSKICGADILMRCADCFADGIGTEPDFAKAFELYQHAERLFYDRLMNGDFLIRRNYDKCIARQSEMRAALQSDLPNYEWTK